MLRPIAIETSEKIKAAIALARKRVKGGGSGIALAAFLVFLGFVLLAVLAPLALSLPPIFQTILGFVPFLALLGGILIAIWVLYRLSKTSETIDETSDFAGTIAKIAYNDAMNIVEDCGLKDKVKRDYSDCLSGQFCMQKAAVFTINNHVYAVLRQKVALECFIMLTPNGQKWPFDYKLNENRNIGKLAPIDVSKDLDAVAWSLDSLSSRDKAQALLAKIEPALKMSKIGGQIPFLWAKERNIALKWDGEDAGSCALIVQEIARALQNQ